MRGPPLPPVKHASVAEALAAAARSPRGLFFANPDDTDRPLPFADLYARAQARAGALAARGVRPGDRVALVLPTGEPFVELFFACHLAGATPVPLYPPVRLGRLEEYHRQTARMLEVSGARLLVADARVRRLLGQAVERARPELGCVTAEEVAAGPSLALRPAPEDLALIQFSSGTTVDPKPVALTHAAVLGNVAAIDAFITAVDPEARAGVCWLPLYHDMGLIGCLLEAVYHPGDLCLIPPEHFLGRPASWLKALSRHRATVSPAPNFAYGLCLKRVRDAELEGVDLSGWRAALNGAEPVSPEVLRRFSERFARWGFAPEALTPVYGLSEASLAVTFSAPGRRFSSVRVDANRLAREGVAAEGAREVVSVGAPVAGVEVAVGEAPGAELPEGRVGKVWVRGPGVMRGYFGNPEATAKALREGWLDTGDLGFVQAGELYLCGRAKDLVILRGANHAPQEFEEALEGLPGLRAGCSAAVGYVPAGAESEELALLCETEGEAPADLVERIRGQVAERTGVRAREVVLLEPGTLPRTSSGKLRRGEALRRWQAGELSAPRKLGALGIAKELVQSELGFLKAALTPGPSPVGRGGRPPDAD